MSIQHFTYEDNALKHLFKLDTPANTYCIGVVDDDGFVVSGYFGKKINSADIGSLMYLDEYPFLPSKNKRDEGAFLDYIPTEYSTNGIGDYRESSLEVETKEGFTATRLSFVDYEIVKGKKKIENLPTSFADPEDVDTLIITCEDKYNHLKVDLIYSVFKDVDVITRSVEVENIGKDSIYLTKVYSACFDIENKDFEVVSLHGSWARERHIESTKLGHLQYVVQSSRGESSHQDHPFLALKTSKTTEDYGEVYAMNFVYSGNFCATAALNQFDFVRMTMGINSKNFKWKLNAGEVFAAPEVVLVYSSEGLGKMTATFHDFYRNHLIRSPYLHQKRPILINNWEATYFDFDSDKLVSIAKEAKNLGIEMLVMDDGWFGNRFDDNRSLGDWKVNENKIKGGLKSLVDRVNEIGLKFGIWFEPEMISPDSDLYREHPDWAIGIAGMDNTRSRNQYVLDLSRPEVVEYTYEQVASICRSANIEYIKWDMNRQLTNLGSAYLPADQMGELSHRYMLAVYKLQDRLITEFPNLLIENCSGGGARFDPGMLYYSPQIWCSDDTDAIERLAIMEGTALIYPLSTIGAHVSAVPNHTVGRVTPMKTRGDVALFGTFGYELDVTKLSDEDKKCVLSQVKAYHEYNDLIREGDYYRIASYRENGEYECFGVVSKDKKEAVYIYVQVNRRANMHSKRVCLRGLNAQCKYIVEDTGQVLPGDVLMNVGINQPIMDSDFSSRLIVLKSV